ncbi:Plancitoxin-1, partial [Trichinella sp. T9]
MKFTAVVCILILLKTSTAQPPDSLSSKIMKSGPNPTWNPSARAISEDENHAIPKTMASFIAEHMNIKVLAYSDDPPNMPPQNVNSKAKGVLLIDNRDNDAAAWFVHTVPKFLAYRGPYSWPASETAKGHMFLCLSFTEAHLNSVAKAIRYQEPFIYANNLSPELLTQHNELSNLATGVQIRVPPFLEHAKFTTKANQVAANIQVIGKHSKSYSGQYQLRKVASPMQFDGVQVRREDDSARWAVVDGKNIVCLTTNDYKATEKQIPGAAVCLENAAPPDSLSSKIMKSGPNPTWNPSARAISEDENHAIPKTMASFIAEHMNIKVLAYSDDPPNMPPQNVNSKAKGVLLIDNRDNDAAAWFVHTVPKFLAYRGPYSWPASETAKGHMFLCLSFTEAHLNSVAKAIRYQEPFIYANNLSPELLTQHNELSNLATGVQIRVPPFLEHAKFTTKANQVAANIQVIGKHSKSYSDMYAKVLKNKLGASIRIWALSDTRSKSICKGQYQLRKVASPMQFDGVQVRREDDSARWAVVDGKNIVCLTTNDYKATEKQIPGAAVCLENAAVYNIFRIAASKVEACNK